MRRSRRGAESKVRFEATAAGFGVHGHVDYDNAGAVLAEGAQQLEQRRGAEPVSIDLDGLRADAGSLVVALLLAWLRHAANHEVEVRFAGLAAAYREIVAVSGLADTLPLRADAGAADS